jgi:transcriptional regulator with XRE-family HTH domain
MALATMMGSRPQQISGWERGASCPSTKFILPLADALGVSVEQILEAVRTDQERT